MLFEPDLLLEIADASQPKPEDAVLYTSAKHLLVLNKTDLGEHPSWAGADAVRISCESGVGFDALSETIRQALHFGDVDWASTPWPSTPAIRRASCWPAPP